MNMHLRNFIELMFGLGLFFNAMLFIPQSVKLFKTKNSRDISLITFSGFNIMQIFTILHGYINKDYILMLGFILSFIFCGVVTFLIVFYRKHKDNFTIDTPGQKSQEYRLEEEKKEVIFTLEYILAHLPAHIYWKDRNGVYLGSNDKQAKSLGFNSGHDLIGKTDFELPWGKDDAVKFRKNDLEVISSGLGKVIEEFAIFDGHKSIVLSQKIPLRNSREEIIGVLGISTNITAEKEAEHLKLENNLQQAKISEQEIFRKDVGQLVHDVSTPLATIQLILDMIKDTTPESQRITLLNAAGAIKGMTGNLLSKYKKDSDENQSPAPTLISQLLAQVLEERKIRSANTPIEFSCNFNDYPFVFININQLAIKRTITNLINNAVDAMDKTKPGIIHLSLSKNNNLIAITIKDNGKGMPPEVLDKLRNHIAVTSGKENGHGIGFTQIYETVTSNHGTINIESAPNQGATITLSFPEIAPPDWLITQLHFNQQDTIVILDDDNSIHGAWDAILQKYQGAITVKHFTQGNEAVAFINSFSDKTKIFLLADFELLKQELTGVEVIKQTQVRSILVTNHYIETTVLQLIKDNNIKMLPKQLAAEVAISINSSDAKENTKQDTTKASVVIIDNVKTYTDQIAAYISKKCQTVVDKYYDPITFSGELAKHIGGNVFTAFYPKTTKFFIDNYFQDTLVGLMLAKALYEAGYTKLYLFSGEALSTKEIPGYLTLISKTDIGEIVKYADDSRV